MDKRYEIATQFVGHYRPISSEGIKALAQVMEPVTLAKGETFVCEGDVVRYIYYIEKGMVRQFYFKNKRDLTEHIAYEGQVVICLESYIRLVPTSLMAETLEPTVIWRISKDDFYRLNDDFREIDLLYRKIFEYALLVSQHKADNTRFETARDRYRILMENHPEIIKRAPMMYIASLLQMSPETLSRVRAAMV
ncbi:MAG: Crp/Fnr family transcriptional regulator [Bacteroidaceae bacterium]|nr:Crp/Fnr family transcriptional regulator [Bacteroidaceae bacterium]